MEINKKLDIDNDIEFLDSGSMAHASNIVMNNTNEGVLNENAIESYFSLPEGDERIVGYIACSDEFIIFTNLNRIFRCNEKTNEQIEVVTNWQWQGGNIIGTYTYNINKELIISITELNTDKNVPLKIINLDKPEYVEGQNDDKYTLTPEIPQFNLNSYNIITGNYMYQGVYNFFIRFKKGDEYTAWYKIGYPIIVYDKGDEVITEKYVYQLPRNNVFDYYRTSYYILKDIVSSDTEKINRNLILDINIKDKTNSYSNYQIAYVINTKSSEIKVCTTTNYSINNRKINITGITNDEDVTLDDLTNTFFNIYNVKTLCNYNNRLYIANYKEENPNIKIDNIDISGIKVRAVNLNTTNADMITKQAINNAVYNFFIHYVYPNGNYTDGIRIQNTIRYNYNISLGEVKRDKEIINLVCSVNEDTKISEVKDKYNEYAAIYNNIDTSNAHPVIKVFEDLHDVRFCNVFPIYDANGIALYKNSNGDRLFRGSLNKNDIQYNHGLKFVFDNIPMYEGFVGYFISYEKSESILTAESMLSSDIDSLNKPTFGDSLENSFTAYYPEFDLVKKAAGNLLYIEKREKFDVEWNDMFDDAYYSWDTGQFTTFKNDYITSIRDVKVYAPNDVISNYGRQGIVNLKCRNNVRIFNSTTNAEKYITFGLIFNITDDIYLKQNKELISLGYIKYVDYAPGKVYNYGYEQYNYNYDYYKVDNMIYDMNRRGVHYDEINPSAKTNDGKYYTEEFPSTNNNAHIFKAPTIGVRMNSYSLYPTFAKNIKSEPIQKYYNFKKHNDDTAEMTTELVIHLYNTMINDLYELKPNFYDYIDKVIVNFDKNNYSNFISDYDKTIRRSDVISNESVENRWKKFRTEQYKIISENKGSIINIVGVGGYLIAHCEHSMFIFNRDSSMRTEDKDVQLVIPDAFDIDYVEMFTSTRGYAGIQKVNQFVCSNYGYIFYDNDAHKLYRFDENNLDEITPGMKNLFRYDVEDINFAIDERNERIICIGTVNANGINKRFSISYSFNSKFWISTHSYWYNDCFNTKNNCYFINNKEEVSSIDNFNINAYGNYTNIITDEDNIFKTELTNDKKPCSFIDVVFNNNNVDKVLDYISYAVNKINDDTYSGLKLLIYTNCCYTDYIDISVPKKTMNDYKHPYYRYGLWVFNWFRNKVENIDTKNPIIRENGKLHPDIKFLTTKSLNDALVVGKYFVVRFVFYDKNKRISVNNIQCY